MAGDTKGYATQIRKMRAHAGVRGDGLAYAATKSVITNTDPGHESKVLSLTLGIRMGSPTATRILPRVYRVQG